MLKECHLDPPVECWRDVTGQKGPSTAVSVDGNVSGQKDPSTENPKNHNSRSSSGMLEGCHRTKRSKYSSYRNPESDEDIFTIMETNISDDKLFHNYGS
ncbi:unnamed protein product [Rodentolepis nana]|uniref:Teneurin N-terminal domain-containing protein n=1 Tax=Rodentolepis nana TaxID=102285 RepID=A0A0R3TC71_RODNA|nr:unnamed protein product [Rodentolepis nana]